MLFAIAIAAASPVSSPALPEGPALTEALRARDAEFFELAFLGCDPARMRTMLTADFEFYHDRDGVVARDAETFVADYARQCVEKQQPDAWRSRRELVRSSLNVHPSPASARSRMASISSMNGRAMAPNGWSAAPASPNCGS